MTNEQVCEKHSLVENQWELNIPIQKSMGTVIMKMGSAMVIRVCHKYRHNHAHSSNIWKWRGPEPHMYTNCSHIDLSTQVNRISILLPIIFLVDIWYIKS